MGNALLPLVLAFLPWPAAAEHRPCGAWLDSLSKYSGRPGDELTLRGAWGPTQGTKQPCINKGDVRALEVLSWSDATLRVRVPRDLQPGSYKVGVYCGIKEGNPFSSDWHDFEVEGAGGAASAPRRPGAREPEPVGPWRGAFEREWKAKGAAARDSRPWAKSLRVLVTPGQDVDAALLRQVADALSAQLRESGAARLTVEVDASGPAPFIQGCVDDGVLSAECLKDAVTRLRSAPGPYAEPILAVVTHAALGRKPRGSFGPPAGLGYHEEGLLVVGDFWRIWNRAQRRGTTDPRFLDHGLAHTARHELMHVLGLPHHDQLGNPGFLEPSPCALCRRLGGEAGKPSPLPECGMRCGSGDDDWRHLRSLGEGFGFCGKCAAAARAFIAGLESP